MTRTARSAAAAAAGAVALAIALGGAGPVAAAAPAGHGKPPQAQGAHGQGGKGGHGPSTDQARRPVLRQIAQVDARLDRTLRESRTSALDGDALTAVQTNIDADHKLLADLATSLQGGTTTVADARAALRGLHPEIYTQVTNFLRQGSRLSAALDEASAAVAAPAELADALAAAGAALDSAMANAVLLTASSSRDDVRAVQADLAAAAAALGPVLDYLEGLADGTDDDAVDPVDPTDPVEDPTVP